jgi:hypothetical protein
MSISKEVNINILNEVYALSAFHGLRTSHPDDQWNQQMTEETEGYLPNSDLNIHGDGTSRDDTNTHLKSNPALEAMQRAVGPGGSLDTDKTNKQSKTNDGQVDHNSLTASDYIATPPNKSADDLLKLNEYVYLRNC